MRTAVSQIPMRCERYLYPGFHNREAWCDIEIYRYRQYDLVVCRQRWDNSGTSVTNRVELIATQVCRDWDLSADRLVWLERYPVSAGIQRQEETCHLVRFGSFDVEEGFSDPRWGRLLVEEAQQFIAGLTVLGMETETRRIRSRLEHEGWRLERRGGNHDIYRHPKVSATIMLPRHRTVSPGVARNIARAAGWED